MGWRFLSPTTDASERTESRPGQTPSILRLDARSLAVARVLLGLVLLVDAALRASSAGRVLAADGMLPPGLARRFVGHPWSWSLAFVGDGVWSGMASLLLEGLAGVLLAAGVATPVVTTVAWVAVVSVVRRTAPMTNAGDVFLACLLFWGQFLPWGARWSWDARRRGAVEAASVQGLAAAAILLQVAAVYLSAGWGKWNDVWRSGDAVAYALSVHDHGTYVGDWIAASGVPARLLTWATMLLETVGPPLLLVGRARLPLVAVFIAFHAAIAVTMDVCLFPWVGAAAWITLLPGTFWDRLMPGSAGGATLTAPRGTAGRIACIASLGVAAAAFLSANGPWARPLPTALARAVQLTFLEQDWRVFGEIRRQRQWVYAAAQLADGSSVDLLRRGRPVEAVLPAGGFHAVEDQRLQKLLWELPKPDRRPFAAHVAAVLAREWNAGRPAGRQAVAVELRGARMLEGAEQGVIQDVLLAAWPGRSPTGRGGLDRFLRGKEGIGGGAEEPAAVPE